ncbi:reelin-like isoform X2 [Ptychodera flava]|uniref:reelin-like isoform X2 n=1 Tax=Ptychodera flava TaxID=63121 RepID=UPI00396A6352
MAPSGAITITLILTACVTVSWGMLPGMTSFYFMCNYQGGLHQADVDSGEVTLRVGIVGNPTFYKPGQMYQVMLTSSKEFDGFLVTGMYPSMKPQAPINPIMAAMMNPVAMAIGHASMCSIIHQHLSLSPQTSLSFFWFAPPAGSGCINFLATGSLHQQILFKDTLALELCEEGTVQQDSPVAEVEDGAVSGVILRDNFDASDKLDTSLWSDLQGGVVSQDCGPVIHANSIVFCQHLGTREITTVHLNTTTASVVQFALSAGTCHPGVGDYSIEISYALREKIDWHLIDKVSAPVTDETQTHIVHLPPEARKEEIVLRWHQDLAMDAYRFQGCWALDNVLVMNSADVPNQLADDFDPVTPANWLFFPTAGVKNKCYSDGKALIFHGSHDNELGYQFVTSRDINLYEDGTQDALLSETFEQLSPPLGWESSGSEISTTCGVIFRGSSLVFNGKHNRKVCTPYLNAADVGNVRFYFAMGSGECDPGDSVDVEVTLYAQRSGSDSLKKLRTMDHQAYRKPKLISVVVPNELQTPSTRFCLIQDEHKGENRHVWAIDELQLLPRLPRNVNKYMQFSLNLECGSSHPANKIDVEMSTDHGVSWALVHSACLPGSCPGSHWADSTTYQADQYEGWVRIIVPLPYAALSTSTRFRWTQPNEDAKTNWGFDSVHIGDGCGNEMCSGHGYCTSKGCSCDAGYSGTYCETVDHPIASSLREHFETSNFTENTQFAEVLGASVGYACGVLSKGKSLVFNEDSTRILVTTELDTTTSRYLQFTIRLGSRSTLGTCPPPDQVTEAVLVHYSCNGGIVWTLLKTLDYEEYQEPKVVTIWLPVTAHKASCQFRWWQPSNSGQDRDVWAIDDITIATVLHNTISSDFSDPEIVKEAFSFHRGKVDDFCGARKAFSFSSAAEPGSVRYIETQSMLLGPSSMVQFDLVMGCGVPFKHLGIDNRVHFDYSTTHGLTWKPVVASCLPPEPGCDEYLTSSVYDSSEYKVWTRVTVPLKAKFSLGPVRFRWQQSDFTGNDSWAIDNIYIGQQCPKFCSGHGRCADGICRCDSGYSGDTCSLEYPLVSTLRSDFENTVLLQSDWLAIHGGKIITGNQGCGIITSGMSLYFSGDGVRKLTSFDMNTQLASFVQFYIRIGGGEEQCTDAFNREESVLLQYSNNGGVSWNLLMELYYKDYRKARFVYAELPPKARTSSTRFRWWQPSHSGTGYNQWALDDVYIGSDNSLNTLQADFHDTDLSLVTSDIWISISNGHVGQLCHSDGTALVFSSSSGERFAVTEYMNLQLGDVVQFKIVIGCGLEFQTDSPVLLQYSVDAGMTWDLMIKPCHPFIKQEGFCEGLTSDYQDGSIYHMGAYNEWRLVVIPVEKKLTSRKIQFRWWQAAAVDAPDFALDDVYIGPSCPDMCNGKGICYHGECVCEQGYHGPSCLSVTPLTNSISDRFDDKTLGSSWERVVGGEIGTSCGILARGQSLYFGSVGPREGRTAALNTTSTKMLQFYIRIGSSTVGQACRLPISRQEDIIVQYSSNNGISWHTLHQLDAKSFSLSAELVTIALPTDAKTESTSFRWIQPYLKKGLSRAQWALDNVLIGANDTCSGGFEDDFYPGESNMWYMIHGGQPLRSCQSNNYALYFNSEIGTSRYAETWDFHVAESTFIQFELIMGCGMTYSAESSVHLEYSQDMGKTWHYVLEECVPPNIGCESFHQSSVYISELYANKTKITVYLPKYTNSPATRFRWIQPSFESRRDTWALDFVYIGDQCPWMCSGHGKCYHGKCLCDSGFSGDNCVPQYPLPQLLKDNFDDPSHLAQWPNHYGGNVDGSCGTLVSGNALVFSKDGLRMLVSPDLDSSNMEYIQFTIKFGCRNPISTEHIDCSRSILVQYSKNGGIIWDLLEEIMYKSNDDHPIPINIKLPLAARMNPTRFRLWQAKHSGAESETWAIDDIIFGGNSKLSNIIDQDFDDGPSESDWLFYPGSHIGPFCPPKKPTVSSVYNNRGHSYDRTALTFGERTGEHSVTSRDIHVNEDTVLQFEINVGCSEQGSSENAIYLKFSQDFGATWKLLQPLCIGAHRVNTMCGGQMSAASVYYRGATEDWQRFIIPLDKLHICGNVRFRWYQGVYGRTETSIPWAIDNVYIGPKCPDNCNGHGWCQANQLCQCDFGYTGANCHALRNHPHFLKEAFETDKINSKKFLQWSGGVITDKCGTLITGKSLHFVNDGLRMLVTTDMDLTTTSSVHFYIKLGCSFKPPSSKNHPVFLQFSVNGGLLWSTMEELHFMHDTNKPSYIAVALPNAARTNSTRIRWWQPSTDGTFLDEWAIDQIFVGGDVYGQMFLEDDFTTSLQQDSNGISTVHDSNWMLYPGSRVEQVCGSHVNALHFTGNDLMRYAITADVRITEHTFLQFDLAMGCTSSELCYDINLEYSTDMGKQWRMLLDDCLPLNVECMEYHTRSVFTADVYNGWNRVIIPLPMYTRSKATRFRWSQPPGFEPAHSWAIRYIYIGRECMDMCSGHGRCNEGFCMCDNGWGGDSCNIPLKPLPKNLRDKFEEQPGADSTEWLKVNGGTVSDFCGPLSSGKALHFNGACNRQLVSTDLDLSEVEHLQFYFMYGCKSAPSNRNQGVFVEYSTNGGISWHHLTELFYDQYTKPSFVSVKLPAAARYRGCRIRWWQPKHSGRGESDWAIDNVLLSGSKTLPRSLKDRFDSDEIQSHWLYTDNTGLGSYCQLPSDLHTSDLSDVLRQLQSMAGDTPVAPAIVGIPDKDESVSIVTEDLLLQPGSVLQFKISVGCNSTSANELIQPVKLFYSTDHGVTWSFLVHQCLPYDPQCNGEVGQPSLYFANQGWRKVVIKLADKILERPVRFRWFQGATSSSASSSHPHWALDDVFISQSCADDCSGHGLCDYPQCICDDGFYGDSCELQVTRLQTTIKDRFEVSSQAPWWSVVQGGDIVRGRYSCGVLREESSLYFSGYGIRQVETVDLDLRGASFIQYHAVIGSKQDTGPCEKPHSRNENVILQYSINGGISWNLLHELDFEQYQTPKHDYIPLPVQARYRTTKIRWWQPVDMETYQYQAQWALDDIFIGGTEINPSFISDRIENDIQEANWEFYPNSRLTNGLCGSQGKQLYWQGGKNDGSDNSVTSRQLIIMEEFMIQFKIVVGCGSQTDPCSVLEPVRLEFNTDPVKPDWQLLRSLCLPGIVDHVECFPYQYHEATLFDTSGFNQWTRITMPLPDKAISSSTQFRWIQPSPTRSAPSWSVDDIYIGEKCPGMCNGHGVCTEAKQCICDPGYQGLSCTPSTKLPHYMIETFEASASPSKWSLVRGGATGRGCGSLLPYAHGKNLYFNGCGIREAVTVALDTSKASEIQFVLQIGSLGQTPTCNIGLQATENIENKAVLLQYSANNGIDWVVIQSHDANDYTTPKRVSYDLPRKAKSKSTKFRWWQPQHSGIGFDQWALDHVELILPREEKMRHSFHNGYGRR